MEHCLQGRLVEEFRNLEPGDRCLSYFQRSYARKKNLWVEPHSQAVGAWPLRGVTSYLGGPVYIGHVSLSLT